MTDKNIQKIIILQKDLPQLRNNGQYFFRYRIKDKANTVFSNWSQKYSISLTNSIASLVSANPPKYDLSQIANQEKIHMTWVMPDSIKVNKFDIYLKWYYTSNAPDTTTQNTTNWIRYSNVLEGTVFDVQVPTNAKHVQLAVMLESYPKFSGYIIDNEPTLLFKTSLRSIPISIDGGIIS